MDVEKIAGDSIEQYDLVQRIGQDAFIDTFLAYDPDSNRHVLISMLNKKYSESTEYRLRYIKRAYNLSQIRHPNIATIYSSGQTSEDRPYVVSEQIEGFSLADRLRRLQQQQSPAHATYALTLVRQIASGLALAERLEYFHYELTPKHILLKNVTLKTDDSAVLVNLDMAFRFAVNPDSIEGSYSAPYLSPEQLNNKNIDGRSHVYSLGIILFQLLTGKLPDQNKPNWQLPLLTLTDQDTPLRELRGDLSPETYALIEKALRTRPGSRYGSLGEFLSAIDAALAAEEFGIRSGAMAESRRPRPFYLAPLLLLLVCISLAAAIWWFNSGNSTTESQAAASGINQSVLGDGTMTASPSPASASVEQNDSTAPIVEKTKIVSAVPIREEKSSLPSDDIQPTALVSVNSAATGESQHSITPSKLAPSKEAPTEDPTEVPTEAPTETPTEAPTETPTEAPTETPTEAPTETPTKEPTATKSIPLSRSEYRITVNSAYLRLGPGSLFPTNGFLLQDETVVIFGRDAGRDVWYVVETADGRTGWISATVGELVGSADLDSIMEAATIPALPTSTPRPPNTPTPPSTPIPNTPPELPSPGDSGGGGLGG